MIVSVTELGQFRRCRRMWDFASFKRQSLEPVVNSPALVLGSLIHKTMEEWTTHPEEDVERIFFDAANAAIDQMRVSYRERVGADISESEMQTTYDALHLGVSMVKRYGLRWGSPTPDGYRMIQTEQTLLVPIPDTDHWECTSCGSVYSERLWPLSENPPKCFRIIQRFGPLIERCHGDITWQPHYLEGTLDGLLEDAKGWLWVLERKTYGKRPSIEKLSREDQFIGYDWMLRQLFPDHHIGGTLYDGMWKRDDVKSIDECYQRYPLMHSDSEVEEYGRHLTMQVKDMENPSIYMNVPWQGCIDCWFQRLCTAVTRDEDVEYVRDTFYQPRKSGVKVDLG